MTTELKPNIHWVGYVDWDVRDFHSYDTKRGATYNAYLVQDDKTALIDTVKAPFAGHLLCNLSDKTSLEAIDYVVCNHAEPDHSGALPEVMKALPNAKLLCNEKCRSALALPLRHRRVGYPARFSGGRDLARQPDADLHEHPDGALARIDVHLCSGGEVAFLDGRLRAAFGHFGAVR